MEMEFSASSLTLIITGMKPIVSPSKSDSATRARSRRRPELSLPLPQRDAALAVPLPLPPPPSNCVTSTSASLPRVDFADLEKVQRIGSGAGGTVYKVVHQKSRHVFALKVLHGNHDDEVRKRICHEIQILRDVDHTNVVRCLDMFDQSGEIQVLLEFMDRGSLEGKHIPDERDLSKITRQILKGIAYLHKKKIVHRDIKPSNLLINSKSEVKIADFGVSRILAQTMDPCNSSVGTIAYMSPERINSDSNEGRYDAQAGDIWSLGVSVLEFYLGRFPFEVKNHGGDWVGLMGAICFSPPPRAPPTASREFREFVSCCLQKDPIRRSPAAKLLHHPFLSKSKESPLPPPRPR